MNVASAKLLTRGVLSKSVRDPNRTKPGRTLKISEVYVTPRNDAKTNLKYPFSNQNAIGGSVSRDVFQDAMALQEISAEQEGVWREWPLLATDGDTAALMQLVSDNKVRQ
jgi:oxalate---CoA ligase